MTNQYDFRSAETSTQELWHAQQYASYHALDGQSVHSMFLIPPNASGPIHIGNALMLALQDIEARYHRAAGKNVLFVPGLDHGGYETQVTYERAVEADGVDTARQDYVPSELYASVEKFVGDNRQQIVSQIAALGTSVDWNHLRYTLDGSAVEAAGDTFRKMVDDNLIERKSYMVHYCPSCATVLADIELKQRDVTATQYLIRFSQVNGEDVQIATMVPEQLFSMTHILVHSKDNRFAHLIGSTLINPSTGADVQVVPSKRNVNWHTKFEHLVPFLPSFDRYDYEYAIRSGLPAADYLDWEGKLLERYPGSPLKEARVAEVEYLAEQGVIAGEFTEQEAKEHLCKKGHEITDLIRLSWFLKIDDKGHSIRKQTLDALEREQLSIFPQWRKKGLMEWLRKMIDWPISRQNVWGIQMPAWYEVDDPNKFMVWFFDENKTRHHGNLQSFLDAGYTLETITAGLQRVYAPADVVWTTAPEQRKLYLPETDTFDTWFSSGAWSVFVFESLEGVDFDDVYPCESVVIGHDLLRLSIARKLFLSVYLTGKLPFSYVYFHPLILGADGQKMSKSIGNSISLDEYLEKYGADTTRLALVSYLGKSDDFIFEDARLKQYAKFVQDIWRMGSAYNIILEHGVAKSDVQRLDDEDFDVVRTVRSLGKSVGTDIERHFFTRAQSKVTDVLPEIEALAQQVAETGSLSAAVAFLQVWPLYVTLLHPFAPHVSEAVYQDMIGVSGLLAQANWPNKM